MPCCGITACICYTRKNSSQTCLDKKVFRAAARLFWFLKKKKEKKEKKEENENDDDISYFVILDKRAPISYPYFLLIMTSIIAFYTTYSLLLNSLYIRSPKVSNFYSINQTYYDYYDHYEEDSSICTRTDNCMEIDFLGGLESAVTIFGACVVTFAIVTYSLLKCTSCIGNSHHCKCCGYCFVIFFQMIGFITPRVLYFLYLFNVGGGFASLIPDKVTGYESNDDDDLPPGYLHYNSQVALLAILDSIAMSMLTPWYLFVEDETKKKRDDSKKMNKYNVRKKAISNV